MSWILSIDTSLEVADIILSNDGKIVGSKTNLHQKDHGSFLEPAIQSLMKEEAVDLDDLSAIAVVNGPGSYTGLRVGIASAKGLCYALNKPLITLNSLEVLTIAAINQYIDETNVMYCPMIDARRMEVFTAMYDQQVNVLLSPKALILEADSFDQFLTNNVIVFFGNGSEKWKTLCGHKNARFINIENKQEAIVQLSYQMVAKQSFTSVAYADAFYIKDFFTTAKVTNK